jgi:hypothetical protein
MHGGVPGHGEKVSLDQSHRNWWRFYSDGMGDSEGERFDL